MSGVTSAKWCTPRQRGDNSPGPMVPPIPADHSAVSDGEPKRREPRSNMSRVVVTGANRGLGLEFTRQLLAAGHEVVATARQPKKAEDLNKLAMKSAGRTLVVPLDV
ncbi:MAG TPA: SDR family NAD(P)-dependent oxidoreductase, partial [Acidimicrobiia bacterium]|nr:SDR family NAD(P)-dependent oxidoreductase [Acidimicrobiia bacterium]